MEASAVSKDNAEDMKKVSFVRAARTDKGVHALGQVCSLKMINVDDADLIPRINSCLPDQIRVWGASLRRVCRRAIFDRCVAGTVRVNKSFNAKNGCDSRIYEYLLPTYVFIPPHPAYYPASKLATNPNPQGLRAFPAPDTLPGGEPAEGRSYQIQPSNPEEIAQKREFRMAPDQLTHLRAILNGYLGTKNFHNFTVGKKPEDVSAKRYIMSFVVSSRSNRLGRNELKLSQCSDPFVKDGMEWVSLKIKGQSFMLHQIRKMIGTKGRRRETVAFGVHLSFRQASRSS